MIALQTVIPIFYDSSSSGTVSGKEIFGLYLACNIILFLMYFIRTAHWLIAKNNSVKFYNYVIWDDGYDYDFPILMAYVFSVVNGIALVVWLSMVITNLL